MSMILVLASAAMGITITGITIANDALEEEDIENYVDDTTQVYSSQMNDIELIKQASIEYGVKQGGSNDEFTTPKGSMLFLENNEGNYNILFNGDFTTEEVNSISEEITEYYNLLVQERTYTKLLEKIKKENYQLEKEEITDDSSIVLTINV